MVSLWFCSNVVIFGHFGKPIALTIGQKMVIFGHFGWCKEDYSLSFWSKNDDSFSLDLKWRFLAILVGVRKAIGFGFGWVWSKNGYFCHFGWCKVD